MIVYDNLFAMLSERGISKTGLAKMAGLSSATLAKLSKNEAVSIKIIEAICEVLKCQPGDIISIKPDNGGETLLSRLLEEKEMKLKGGLYHLTQITLAYNSNRIEGSRLSEDQTRYIYETHTIAADPDEAIRIDDITETVNHFRCFDYMLETANEPLCEEIIKTLHKLLKSGTTDSEKKWFAVGDYKKRANIVGDMETVPPAKVAEEVKKLLNDYLNKEQSTIEDIIRFHVRFERIHPFQDGNGRVGRLIMFRECLHNGIVPFIIEDEHKLFYYRGIKEFDSEKGYLTDTCLNSQDIYQKYIDYFYKEDTE